VDLKTDDRLKSQFCKTTAGKQSFVVLAASLLLKSLCRKTHFDEASFINHTNNVTMKKCLLIGGLLVILATTLAHEYILLASAFTPKLGDTLQMHLFVSDGFNIDMERPVQTAITKKFELLTNEGSKNLLINATNNTYPVATIPVNFKGLGLLHMSRDYAYISLPVAKFANYLKEDNIKNITLITNGSKPIQRERYTRYIKALVQSEPLVNDTIYKSVTSQAFEIVLLQNPYKLKSGQTLQARVLYNGKPLANKVITARNRTGNLPAIATSSRTNNQGVCTFTLSRRGEWFIHATHMIPCADTAIADWESFWASYSFLVP